jgi:TP901 family phage tail tape measure protein
MAEEISQVLGFDASKALATLNELDKTMATFEGRLQSTATRFGFFNREAGRTVNALIQIAQHGKSAAASLHAVVTALSGSAQRDATADARAAAAATDTLASSLAKADLAGRNASVKVGDALIKIGRQSTATSKEVQTAAVRMTTSLGLLSRVVFTQFIVRGLSQLRNAFRGTVSEAIKFQQSLALITTIDDSGQSLTQLSDRVRGISDQFNIPLLETAAGLYQTISNQIGDAAQSTAFLTEAAKFARSTNSSLENSVDLLSGALKSFNLEVTDTTRVSSIFFKAIDLGRITSDQLANAFGRVGPAAADLGVELEEVAAAIAAISVRGSSTPESLTQFRNILTALTKPSVAMRKAFRELGFESAELAIKTNGVSGVLRELVKSADGSAEALARLFPNIRGLNGVAALTADELLTLAKNTDEMTEAGRNFNESKFLQVIATDAETVTSQINKLKNAFTVDLGQAFLKAVADFAKLTGGVENFTDVIKTAPALIAGVGASLVAAFTASRVAALAFGASLPFIVGQLALIPAAFGAGKAIGDFFDTKVFNATFAELKELRLENEEGLREFTATLQSEADKANKVDADRLKAVLQVSQGISAAYLSQANAVIGANASLVSNTSASLTTITDAFEKLTQAEANAAAGALGIQNDSANRLQSLQDRIADLDFEKRTKNLSEANKALEITRRAANTASEASSLLARAGGDQDKINRGLALFKQAQEFNKQALTLSEEIGSAQQITRLEQQKRDIIEQQVDAEERLSRSQALRVKNLQSQRTSHLQLLDAVRSVRPSKRSVTNDGSRLSKLYRTSRSKSTPQNSKS